MKRTKYLKQIVVKIFPPKPAKPMRGVYRAPNANHWKAGYEDVILAHIAEQLEKTYPHSAFRMVEVGRGQFNLCYDGPQDGGVGHLLKAVITEGQ